MMVGNNPVRITHQKSVYLYVRELMRETLTEMEDQLVMMHCGIYTKGKVVTFSQLAEHFWLSNAQQAKAVYQNAVARTRAAIPGSRLEHWINCYHVSYCPDGGHALRVAVDAPVPDWDIYFQAEKEA